ncbi:MAG TPA: M48 family metallopeptidase [Burkholderiales bacterium]|nr:M48 family metallopeptidase [Burkholderiales bacterium]
MLLIACATQTPSWQADKIAQIPASHLQLIDSTSQQTIGTISTERVRRLLAVKDRIAAASGQSATLFISSGNEANAFSGYFTGGPFVAFNLGMIDLLGDDDDACAAIMGHEFAHLRLGHASTRKEREQTRQGAAGLVGLLLGLVHVPAGGTIADLGMQAASTVYSRDEERDADRYGVGYMKKAGYDPKGAVRAWDRMSKTSGFSIPFLSTHPQSGERLETMKQLAGE